MVPGSRSRLDRRCSNAVCKWNPAAALELERGGRTLTDSRGLPLDPSTPAVAGIIVRVIVGRDRADGEEPA